MKIAISSTGDSLEAQVDQAFGRCRYFVVYDSDSDTHVFVPNQGSGMSGGAGATAAQTVIGQGVNQIITGKVGFKSRPILQDAGITIHENQSGTIGDILSTLGSAIKALKTKVAQKAASVGDSISTTGNTGGYCFCQACGYQGAGEPGVPCFKQRCPKCGSGLERKYR